MNEKYILEIKREKNDNKYMNMKDKSVRNIGKKPATNSLGW